MGEPARIGLVPLYLALYDQVAPQYRAPMEAFARRVAERLTSAGLAVELGGICSLRAEVSETVAELTARGVDLLATLHLAYFPSLECADALESSQLPLVLLDTTPDPAFAEDATMDHLFANHGIHGVQDLACVLRRRERRYVVAVGHVDDEGFLRDVVCAARAAQAARHLRSARVLLLGDEFPGMGDFAVEPGVLNRALGVSVRRLAVSELAARLQQVSERDLALEAAADAERFDCSRVSPQALNASNRVGLALRAMLEEFDADAFSFNFMSFTLQAGVPTVPFLEASKAMARGIGYAGEGDALTAALVGALLTGFGAVTFTEMFCPDWAGDAIFMSHMGECNPALAGARGTLVEKQYVFGEVENPVVALFPLASGAATLVNLAPGPGDRFGLIASRVRVLDRVSRGGFPDVPHFWLQPMDADVGAFLRRYSECGGTHHCALVLGDEVEALSRMARFLGLSIDRL